MLAAALAYLAVAGFFMGAAALLVALEGYVSRRRAAREEARSADLVRQVDRGLSAR